LRSWVYTDVMGHFRMTDKTNKYYKLTLVLGLLFLATYFLNDYLFEQLWIFAFLPLGLFGLAFLVFFILTVTQKNKRGILIGILITGTVFATEIFSSELFKSKKILEATLMDDLSAIHLTLRADNTFEVVSSTMFSEQTFKGDYRLVDNKIVFKDRPYDNDFIPDTLVIVGDKIICRFDKSGNAVTDFATYFDIKKNETKNAP
jgi:Na+/proline symporter